MTPTVMKIIKELSLATHLYYHSTMDSAIRRQCFFCVYLHLQHTESFLLFQANLQKLTDFMFSHTFINCISYSFYICPVLLRILPSKRFDQFWKMCHTKSQNVTKILIMTQISQLKTTHQQYVSFACLHVSPFRTSSTNSLMHIVYVYIPSF